MTPLFTVFQMVALYKDPQGEDVFKNVTVKDVKPNSILGYNVNTKFTEVDDDSEPINVRERVSRIEEKLKEENKNGQEHIC